MKVEKTIIEGVYIVTPKTFGDNRGWFMESYSANRYKEYGIMADFVQDDHSFNAQKGTLRGLHFQLNPKAQAKLVRVIRGAMIDVVVDIRKGSPTYKKWISVELSAENKKQIYMPRGMAHGYVTLTDNVEVNYKVDNFYAPETESGIMYNDPELNINWGIDNPILSEKDKKMPLFKDSIINFVYGEDE
ncbi:MAG: dTDP-4-dehydrorhamnose 3,5-epimerase [Megamonas funiformis]|jgi:dTDP-4-dehydrorhamnose 3,5-epimerase|uniref:dTDP-4-dehydrorhamnose 3,5-epimerase n=1 Tax=Megamonas funiformis TaxID=437897 RepID=UPI00267619A8|nr:dTDP-4-dehydrorhamnose 3,5-epimerase [Megamonas funiformis]MBD9297106.1 dTDP-4-dehydrorhamnose 3,5-epimerase [Megamonas funiformis]